MNYKNRQLNQLISELRDEGGVDYLLDQIHEDIYSRMKINVDKEYHNELFFVLKGLKEVESAIQNCANNALKELEKDN